MGISKVYNDMRHLHTCAHAIYIYICVCVCVKAMLKQAKLATHVISIQ